MDSPLAPARAVEHLGRDVDSTARWHRARLQSHGEAIARLSRTVASDAERTLEARTARTRATRRRLVASQAKLDRRLAKARETHLARVEKQRRIERETVRRLGRRDLWDKILVLSSLPLFTAYGQRGAPFGANSLALLLTLLVFLVGDQIVDALLGTEKPSPYPVRDADLWTYLAPAANVLAGWWLLTDRQHERFVAGRTVIPIGQFTTEADPALPLKLVYRYTGDIPVVDVVGRDHQEDFKTFIGVPAVATLSAFVRSADGDINDAQVRTLTAKVTQGVLTVTITVVADDTLPVPQVLDALEVAWMVDTQEPSSPLSAK